jgi:hypothetical protein
MEKLNIKSSIQFNKWERPDFIPSSPSSAYKNKGWISWGDFLGSNSISMNEKSKMFLKFNEAKIFVQKLKLSHKFIYLEYISKNNILFLPKRPEFIYKEHWIGYIDYLGCEPLRTSYGEKRIKEFLDENNFEYIRQKKFKLCKSKMELPFDFYLPSLNLCIEYDGQQHFMSVSKYGGEKYLKKVKINDEIKNKFCSDNNIIIIRIPYNKKSKISQILKEKLNIL